jgi:hypothetical protein
MKKSLDRDRTAFRDLLEIQKKKKEYLYSDAKPEATPVVEEEKHPEPQHAIYVVTPAGTPQKKTGTPASSVKSKASFTSPIGLRSRLVTMRNRRYSYGSPIRFSRAPSRFASPTMSSFSMTMFTDYPLQRAHIVRLRDIIRPMEEEKLDVIRDNQIYGFKFNDWLHQNEKSFPILSMKGNKTTFGRHIKTNWHKKKREFTFSVARKASNVQISALIQYIRENLPHLSRVSTFVRRKVWDKMTGVTSNVLMEDLIHKHLKAKTKITVKLRW